MNVTVKGKQNRCHKWMVEESKQEVGMGEDRGRKYWERQLEWDDISGMNENPSAMENPRNL